MRDDTHYSVLGIPETATQVEIKAAYRNLLKQIHPDTVSTLSPDLRHEAEDVTKQINLAYSVLSDEDRRREYDLTLLERRAATEENLPHPNSSSHVAYCPTCGAQMDPVAGCTGHTWDIGFQKRLRTLRRRRRRHRRHSLRRWVVRHPFLAVAYLLIVVAVLVFLVYVVFTFVPGPSAAVPNEIYRMHMDGLSFGIGRIVVTTGASRRWLRLPEPFAAICGLD